MMRFSEDKIDRLVCSDGIERESVDAQRAQLINLVSGLLLLGVGIYDLVSNWELIKAYS